MQKPLQDRPGGETLLQTPRAVCHWVLRSLCSFGCSLSSTGHTGWMGASPQHSHQSWLRRAQPHSEGAGTVLGRVTHTYTLSHSHTHMYHLPSNKASQQDGIFPKNNPPFPHQMNKDTPVFHDAEESPHSSQNAWNKAGGDDLGQVKVSLWLERAEGKWSVLDGAGPGAPGLQDPSSVLWDHMEKSLNLSSSAASSVTKGKGECVRQEHPSWGLLGHSTRTLGGPGQDRAGDGPMGHRRDGGKLQCETRALPASLEQETQRKGPAECGLGKTLLGEAPRPSRR